MKKFTIILFLCLSIIAKAQVLPTAQSFKQQDSIYWENALSLIKPQITTGILYSKVVPFSNLYNFNSADYNTADAGLFKQALSEMHRASDNASQFITVDELALYKKQIYASNANAGTPIVEIGVLNTSFDFLYYDEDDENNGGLHLINDVYTPISGKPSVLTKHITMISPQREMVVAANNGAVSYRINNAFYFNKHKKIKNLTADFGSGNVTLIDNQVINTSVYTENYTTFGKKTLVFHVTYTDNTSITTYAHIEIVNPQSLIVAPATNNCVKTNIIRYTSTIPYQGYDENTEIYGELEYKIFFANTNGMGSCDLSRIKKPFIVIDGFDPGDKRRIELDDCQFDPVCRKINENLNDEFVPEDYHSIYSLMQYGDGTDKNLVYNLRDNGYDYDVIIINLPTDRNPSDYEDIQHDYGADFIQRNAMTVASFIKEVNQALANNNSTEQLVVAGPSMGGQITRYALAYMEKMEQDTGDRSWDHNTRLWVSIDSPHQGANIPLAVQGSTYFLGYIHGSEETRKKYDQKLRSPAAKEMLIDHYDYFSSATKHPYFLNYYADLSSNGLPGSNGYPTKSRNIAVINGSISGETFANPGDCFLDMKGYVPGFFLGAAFWWVHINLFSVKNNFQQNYNQSGMVFDIWAARLNINFYNSLNVERTNPNWQGSLDVMPGSYVNSGNDLKEGIIKNLKDNYIQRDMHIPSTEDGTVVPQTFMPTHSTLDTSGFTDWYQPIDRNLVCSGQTPFDNYYGALSNTYHVTFTQESKDWMFAELDADPVNGPFPPPSVYIPSNTEIVGNDLVCYNSTANYSTTLNDCAGAITWETSNNLVIINDNNSNIDVRAINSNYSGTGWIKATIKNITFTKNVMIGKPNISNISFNRVAHYSFQNQRWNFLAALYAGNMLSVNYIWEWQVPNSMILQGSPYDSYINFRPNVNSDTQMTISVRASNNCGCSGWKSQIFDVIGGGNNSNNNRDIIEY